MSSASESSEHGNALSVAVRAGLDEAHETLRRFDALASKDPFGPEFTEHSVAFDEQIHPARVTHYFDVDASRRDRAEDVLSRFESLSVALARPLPDRLARELRRLVPGSATIRQLVLGIDARPASDATRIKLYLLFGAPDPDCVSSVADAAAVPDVRGLDPAEVFLLGIDLGADGVSEMKSYLRLDRSRLARVVRPTDAVRTLLDEPRSVVLAQAHRRPDRRQLHLEAGRVDRHARWLAERATHQPALRDLIRHLAALEARVPGRRIEPYIVGLPLREGHLDPNRGNVYVHVTDRTGPTNPRPVPGASRRDGGTT